MTGIADAIRKVTLATDREIESGRRSVALDADDLIQVLLAIADELDPPLKPERKPKRKSKP